MTNKEYLQDYARQATIADLNEATKAEALEALKHLPAIPKRDETGEAQRQLIIELRKVIAECDARSAEALQKCEEIQTAIDGVQDLRQRKILQLRYTQRPAVTWERIAEQLNYTFEHCHNLHREALKNIQRP